MGFEKWGTAVLGHFELHPDQASMVAALAHPPAVRVGFHVKGRPPFPVDAPLDRLLAMPAKHHSCPASFRWIAACAFFPNAFSVITPSFTLVSSRRAM